MGNLACDTSVKSRFHLCLNSLKKVKITELVQLCSKEDIVAYYKLKGNVPFNTLLCDQKLYTSWLQKYDEKIPIDM